MVSITLTASPASGLLESSSVKTIMPLFEGTTSADVWYLSILNFSDHFIGYTFGSRLRCGCRHDFILLGERASHFEGDEWKQVQSSVCRLDNSAGHLLPPRTILLLSIYIHSILVLRVQRNRDNWSLPNSLSLEHVQQSWRVDGRAANIAATHLNTREPGPAISDFLSAFVLDEFPMSLQERTREGEKAMRMTKMTQVQHIRS